MAEYAQDDEITVVRAQAAEVITYTGRVVALAIMLAVVGGLLMTSGICIGVALATVVLHA